MILLVQSGTPNRQYLSLDGVAFFENLRFTSKIIPSDSTYRARSTKIELKMKPADTKDRWVDKYVYSDTVDGSAEPTLSRESIKNWDNIAANCLIDETALQATTGSSRFATKKKHQMYHPKPEVFSSAEQIASALFSQVRYSPYCTMF